MTPTDRDLAHACEDYQRTYRRQQLARQAAATAVPIPDGILEEGAQRFLSTNTSRKAFLAGGAGLAIALSGLRLGRPDPRRIFEAAAADAAKAGPHPILVLIYQSGGNDGLNTLVPLTGGDRTIYEQQRTRIGLAPGDGLLPLGGPHASADFAWNPACAGLQTLYDAGQLAVLPAIDYPEPNLSHFHSAHFWRSGVPDFSQTTGWLGRYLDVVGATSSNPLQGVAVQWGTDEVLLSRRAPTCALYDPRSFDLSTDGVWRDPNTGQGDPRAVTGAVTQALLQTCPHVVLTVDPNNAPAIRAYRRLGYVEEGIRVFSEGDRCMVMRLSRQAYEGR